MTQQYGCAGVLFGARETCPEPADEMVRVVLPDANGELRGLVLWLCDEHAAALARAMDERDGGHDA